jgi:hypothetical protein
MGHFFLKYIVELGGKSHKYSLMDFKNISLL